MDYLAEFMARFEILSQHPNYGVRVLNVLVNEAFRQMGTVFDVLSPQEIHETFLRTVSKSKHDHSALIAYLLFIATTYRNELMK